MGIERMSFFLSTENEKALKDAATADGRNFSQFIQILLEDHTEGQVTTQSTKVKAKPVKKKIRVKRRVKKS